MGICSAGDIGVQVGKCDGVLRLSTTAGNDQEASPESMGCSEQEAEEGQAIPQVDAAYISALNRIADAIILLAQVQAGELDENQEDDDHYQVDLSGRRIS